MSFSSIFGRFSAILNSFELAPNEVAHEAAKLVHTEFADVYNTITSKLKTEVSDFEKELLVITGNYVRDVRVLFGSVKPGDTTITQNVTPATNIIVTPELGATNIPAVTINGSGAVLNPITQTSPSLITTDIKNIPASVLTPATPIDAEEKTDTPD